MARARSRNRRLRSNESTLLQLLPELHWDVVIEPSHVRPNLLGGTRAGYDRDYGRMTKRELQRGSAEGHPEKLTNSRSRPDPLHDILGGQGISVGGSRDRAAR